MNRQITLLSGLLSAFCVVAEAQAPRIGGIRTSTVIIPSSKITQSPSLGEPNATESRGPAARFAPGRAPTPPLPNMDLQAAPEGKLDITLTPARPAFFNRAYLRYDYPRSVYIATNTAYAEYSKQNVPGFFSYAVRLEKAKKYLLELTVKVEPANGTLAHSIGDQQSQHILGAGVQTISTTVEPEATGWVTGTLHQSNTNAPTSWRVYSLTVKEL